MNTVAKDKSRIIWQVCDVLSSGNIDAAKTIIEKQYPFGQPLGGERKYADDDKVKIFIRDGFIDRYSGQRLIFPGVLKIISDIVPLQFPYHPNWDMRKGHIAYWELYPTVDHKVPVTRGGLDEPSNLVTTSMLHNSAKANATYEELGWKLYPRGDFKEWDGLLQWFLKFCQAHREYLADPYAKRWYNAVLKAL